MTAKAIAAAKVPATTKAGKGVIAIPVITDLPKPIGHASRHRRDEARAPVGRPRAVQNRALRHFGLEGPGPPPALTISCPDAGQVAMGWWMLLLHLAPPLHRI